jgi:hypothetical protein
MTHHKAEYRLLFKPLGDNAWQIVIQFLEYESAEYYIGGSGAGEYKIEKVWLV